MKTSSSTNIWCETPASNCNNSRRKCRRQLLTVVSSSLEKVVSSVTQPFMSTQLSRCWLLYCTLSSFDYNIPFHDMPHRRRRRARESKGGNETLLQCAGVWDLAHDNEWIKFITTYAIKYNDGNQVDENAAIISSAAAEEEVAVEVDQKGDWKISLLHFWESLSKKKTRLHSTNHDCAVHWWSRPRLH